MSLLYTFAFGTQAYYKMLTTPMDYEDFVEQCCREGAMPKDAIKGVLTLVAEKLALCMAEGRAVKIDGIGTFTAKLGVRDDMLPDAFESGERRHNAGVIEDYVSPKSDNFYSVIGCSI